MSSPVMPSGIGKTWKGEEMTGKSERKKGCTLTKGTPVCIILFVEKKKGGEHFAECE